MKKILLTAIISFAILTLSGCRPAATAKKAEVTVNETEVLPTETPVSDISPSKNTPPKTYVSAKDAAPKEKESSNAEDEKETEEVAIPEDVYRCIKTINPYGSWQTSDSYDDFFAVVYRDDKVTIDNYLQQGDKKGLLESFELTERDKEHENIVKTLLGSETAEVESYRLGDKYIDILPDKGIIIREVANDGFMFYARDGYDSSLIANYENVTVTTNDSYSVSPFSSEEEESSDTAE